MSSRYHGLLMFHVAPLILILALLVQSIPGLTGSDCASVATATCQSPEAAGTRAAEDCACCCGDDDQDLAGGITGKNAAVCCCGQTPHEKPAVPAGDPKHEQLEQLLSFVPVIIGILPPEATPLAAVLGHSVPTPYRPTNSIQSLLCVWTT